MVGWPGDTLDCRTGNRTPYLHSLPGKTLFTLISPNILSIVLADFTSRIGIASTISVVKIGNCKIC